MSYLFSFSFWVSWILRCNFAFICFSKRDTSNCILLSLISFVLYSNSFFFRYVNFKRSSEVCDESMVAGKASFSEMGSCCCKPSNRCESLIGLRSLAGGYWETTALTLSRHSGLSRMFALTSRMAYSKSWLQTSIL